MLIDEEQNRLEAEAARPKSPLREPNNQNSDFVRRLFAAAVIVAGVALVYCAAYMLRYEVIIIPKASSYELTIVQYLVKDRWTGEIEAIWQAPNGKVIQSKYHPFDGGRDADIQPAAPTNFIPLDQGAEVVE